MGFVEEAKAKVAQSVQLPTGYRIAWGGQFENQQRAAARLALVVPVVAGLIFVLPVLHLRLGAPGLLVLATSRSRWWAASWGCG